MLLFGCHRYPTEPSRKEDKGATENGYFYITAPEGGSRTDLDSALNIRWIASNKVVDSPDVRISLLQDSTFLRIIDSATSNDGSYTWLLSGLGSGTSYQVKISTSDTTQFDISGFFEFYSRYSGSLTMTYPDGDTRLMLDSADTLRWVYTDFPGPRLRLELYCDTEFVMTIVESMATTLKKYPWNSIYSPRGTNDRYRIKITSEHDAAISSYSDYFTIKSDYYGGFTFTDPVASSTWSSGDTATIQWDTIGDPGPTVAITLLDHDTLFKTITTNAPDNGSFTWVTEKGMTTGSDYRVRIVSADDAGISETSDPFTIDGIDIDTFEPDNDRTSAHELTLDSIDHHTITMHDTDWVSFTADSGSLYLIIGSGEEGFVFDWTLYLDDETITVDTAPPPSGSSWSQLWDCEKSGDYHVMITPRDSAGTGVYSLIICKFDSSAIASFIFPEAGSVVTAGTAETIRWEPDSVIFGSSVQLYLYEGSERLMPLSSAAIPNSGSFEWSIPEGFTSGDDYHLRLVSASDSRLFGDGASFSIVGMLPDTFENDNLKSDASAITIGTDQDRSISWNDTDWVRFSAKSGLRYIFLLQSSDSFSTAVSLVPYSSTKAIFDGSTDSTGHYMTVWDCRSNADHCLRITAATDDAYGTYTLTILSFDTLSAVHFTAPVASSIHLCGTPLTVSWEAEPIITGDTVALSLYRGNALQQTIAARHPSGTTSYTWNIPDSLPPAKNYRVKLTNSTNELLTRYSPEFTISDLVPDDFESDGTPARASIAHFDSLQNHTIIFNDTDYIKISADSAAVFLFTLTGTNKFAVNAALYADPAEKALLTFSTQSEGKRTTVWQCPATGTWYFRMTGTSASTTGSYSFMVSAFDPGSAVNFVAPTTGTSWWVDSTYLLQWTTDNNFFDGMVSLYLFKGSDSLLRIANTITNNDSVSWHLHPSLASGTDYRIKLVNTTEPLLYGISPPFTINGLPGDDYEPDNSWDEARLFTFDSTEPHNFTWNDTDYIKFPVDSGSSYRFVLAGNNSLRIHAVISYENSWDQGFTMTLSSGDTLKWVWTSDRNTTAYVRFYPYLASITPTGSYSISVSAFNPLTSITFISPTAGMVIDEGSTLAIEWIPDTVLLSDNVYIDLYKADINVFGSSGVFPDPNSGNAAWTVRENTYLTGSDYRIRITNSSTKSLYGYSPWFTINGVDATPDAYEVDNTSDGAKSITSGELQEHNLYSNDIDWIVLTTVKDDRYVLIGDADRKTSLSLYKGTPSSPVGTLSFDKKLRKQITGTADGTWYFSISASEAKGVFYTYTFGVVKLDATNALTITSPAEGAVLTTGEDNLLVWTGDTSLYGNRFIIYIYKDNKQYAMQTADNMGSHIWNANGIVSGSNYSLKVESMIDSSLYAYSPVFSIVGTDVDAYEPDDTPANAADIAINTLQQHNLTVNDTDWITFEAESGGDYIFQCFKDKDLSFYFNLHDSARGMGSYEYVQSESFLPNKDTLVFSWTCKTDGMYFLKCYANNQYIAADYQINIIKFDSTQTIEITEPTESTVWTAGSNGNIIWTPEADNFGAQIHIYLLKDSVDVVTRLHQVNSGTFSLPVPSDAEPGTDYRIAITRVDMKIWKPYYSSYFTISVSP